MQVTTFTESETYFPQEQAENGHGRNPFIQLLEDYDFPQPQRGDILQGEILRIEDDVLFVDVGSKRDAMVPYEEVDQLDEAFLENLSRGDEVPVYVTRTPVGDEQLLVSLERGLEKLDWERAEELIENGEMIELKVVGHNKGGLIVKFGRLQGFVPNSHIPQIRYVRQTQERQRFKAQQIGETMALKAIEVNQKKERFVLSATAVQKEQRRARLKALEEGEVVSGQVVSIKKYGAFVDIGQGITGLLHISKISWHKVEHPADVLTVGDEVELMVDDIELARERISLNRKILQPSPWQQFAQAHDVNDLVTGEVTAVVEYGVFVKMAEGMEGLLHQNEMNLPTNAEPADILQPGDTVLVRIVDLDPDRQRLGLSMRRVSAAEEMVWMANKTEKPVAVDA